MVIEEISMDKKLWLEGIGAKAFPEPIKYVYTFPGYNGWFNLSERYISETSLDELQETYKQNEKYVWSLLHSKNNRGISTQMLNIFKKSFGFKIFKRFRNFISGKT